MFFKRASKTAAPKPALGSVQTIPEIFYGGSDPEAELHGAGVNKIVKPSSVTSSSGGKDESGVSQSKTKLIATAMIVIFVLVSGGAAWGYWKYLGGGSGPVIAEVKTEQKTAEELVVTQTASENITTSTELITENIIPTTTAAIPTSTKSLGVNFAITELAADFPTINQMNAVDFDSDTLTDAEEELFGADQSIFDTDKDGYSDGQELLNLYNPKGTDPVRLAESGLVREFTHPKDTYRWYYPISWQAGSVDAASNTMLFTAANGDYVEARIFTKNSSEDFTAWFGRVAKDQQITDLQIVSNSFKTTYYKRKDNLVMYVDFPGQVLAIIYHPLVNAPINYRTTLQMMMESLRVTGVVGAVGL